MGIRASDNIRLRKAIRKYQAQEGHGSISALVREIGVSRQFITKFLDGYGMGAGNFEKCAEFLKGFNIRVEDFTDEPEEDSTTYTVVNFPSEIAVMELMRSLALSSRPAPKRMERVTSMLREINDARGKARELVAEFKKMEAEINASQG